MKTLVRRILFAYAFLTVAPGLGKLRVDPADTGRSTGFYPLVGLTIGFVLSPLGFAGGLSPFTLAVMLWVAELFLTRGLHADGLIDTFDGFLSGRRGREEVLGIMRDSRLGALGFLGAFSLFSLKIAVLYEILSNAGGAAPLLDAPFLAAWFPGAPQSGLRMGRYPLILAVVPALSRGGVPLACALFPYAGGGRGLGKSFTETVTAGQAVLSFLFMAAFSLIPGNLFCLLLPPALFLFWAGWGCLCMGRIRGMTGDTMGAGVELSELFCLVLVRVLFL